MMQHHKYSLRELENMMGFERDLYVGFYCNILKKKMKRKKTKKQKREDSRMVDKINKTVDDEVAKKDLNGDGHISQEEMEMDLEFKEKN